MNNMQLYIDGAFASPRMDPTGNRYYFYDGWGCTDPAKYRDSGFTATTDDFGTYRYSVAVLVSAGSGTFTDTIKVYAGSILGTQELTIE
jgi:hypothetical protein